jgi:electron transport complex protein RnfB
MPIDIADAIDALLPQTQCTRCGYDGCRPYAEAILAGKADINQCPPGGTQTIISLAALLRRDVKPLNPLYGVERAPVVVLIDEAWCIGCTLCIQACPVDAIVGAPKLMHTVLLEHCTGCELCIPPCPVDCIRLESIDQLRQDGVCIGHADAAQRARDARSRHAFRQFRLARDLTERSDRSDEKAARKPDRVEQASMAEQEQKQAAIRAALERARARRSASGGSRA